MKLVLSFVFAIVLPVHALNTAPFESRLDQFVDQLVESDVVILGETHPNPLNSVHFLQIIENLERRYPGKLAVVGLETYVEFQSLINQYLTSGDPNLLLSTKDDDILRGHHQDAMIKRNSINIFQEIFFINQRRSDPVRVVAMDALPDSSMSFTEWKKKNSQIELLKWAATRDEHMLERLRPHIDRAIDNQQLTLVFIGNMHLQKHAALESSIPLTGLSVRTEWLGRRMQAAYPNTVAVLQSNNNSQLEDVIEVDLRKKNTTEIHYVNIRQSRYEDILQKYFYTKTDIPKFVRLKYEPENSTIGDNYDYYVFFPRTLKYKK